MEPRPSGAADSGPPFLSGLLGLVKNMFGLLLNRIELVALEFSEARTNFLKLALVFALGLIAAWFAVAFWSGLLVVLAWETLGWKILLIMAAVFTLLALGLFLHARAMLKQNKLSLPATMSELRNDRDALL